LLIEKKNRMEPWLIIVLILAGICLLLLLKYAYDRWKLYKKIEKNQREALKNHYRGVSAYTEHCPDCGGLTTEYTSTCKCDM